MRHKPEEFKELKFDGKLWKTGTSTVITIPSDIAKKLNRDERVVVILKRWE